MPFTWCQHCWQQRRCLLLSLATFNIIRLRNKCTWEESRPGPAEPGPALVPVSIAGVRRGDVDRVAVDKVQLYIPRVDKSRGVVDNTSVGRRERGRSRAGEVREMRCLPMCSFRPLRTRATRAAAAASNSNSNMTQHHTMELEKKRRKENKTNKTHRLLRFPRNRRAR